MTTTTELELLRIQALAADQHGHHIYTNPRDSNSWKSNEAWVKAASPAAVLALMDRIDDQDTQLSRARSEAKHWHSNHNRMAAQLRIFTQRPDLPVNLADRLPWYRELVRLQDVEAKAAAKCLHQIAAPEPAGDAAPAWNSIHLDFKQATAVLEMFGGEAGEVVLMHGPIGHSGTGLYAVWTADPEGSVYLGETDEEAEPDAPASPALQAATPAPAAVAVPPLTPDEARWAAQRARLMNGPSDTTQPSEYAMAGALALSAKLAAAPSIDDLCARIKAADDAAADNDYMLDSNDCIKVLRGQWKGPLAMDKPDAPAQAVLAEAYEKELSKVSLRNYDLRMEKAALVAALQAQAQEHATQLAGQGCGNCFEGKSDLDHVCRKCGGTGAAGRAQEDARVYPAIEPVSIIWHASPEAVDAAHWTPICEAEGITLEELRQGVSVGVDERGVETEFSQAAVLQSMRDMGFWGFVDTKTRTIHAWADTATPDSAIMEFLGHEIGHVTGTPDERDWEEEQRADQYGGLVKMAHALLLTRPRAQEHATQLAGQGQEDARSDALQDSAYAAGMLTGWNLCIAGDEAAFSKARGDRMTGAVRALKEANANANANATAPAQAQEDARDLQIAKLTKAYTELSSMFHDQIVGQQAAYIEWQHGGGAEVAMGWIENGLCGPGHIPDEDDPYGKEAQAWFDANKSDPLPACHCGRPSNQLWMGQGFCSNAHYDAARAAQGGAA